MAIKVTAQEYLSKSETKLRGFKREWEAFTAEVPDKFMSLVRSGIRPSISRSSSGAGQIGVSLTFESNMDAAKAYIEEIKVKITNKSDEVNNYISEMDQKIRQYLDEGISSELFSKLVKNLNDWIDYIPKMSFKIAGDRTVNFEASDETLAIQKKWKKISAEEVRKMEAKSYGVALADLDRHKAYLAAKAQKNSAKTSGAMKKAEKAFAAMKGYLDSAELTHSCAAAAAKLLAGEEEEARIQKEREEARKREEAERLRKAVEAYEKEVVEVAKARQVYLNAETDRIEAKHKQAMDAIKADYDAAYGQNRKEAETAAGDKARCERELEEAGLFAFGKKKQLREDIETLTEKLRTLEREKKQLDADYEKAAEDQKRALQDAHKALTKTVAKKFVMPKDPRK